jgi:acetylglutamate kinase
VQATKRPPRVVAGGGPDAIDFGHVGDVVGVNEKLLSLLVGAGFVPVVACLGADSAGNVYNINADVVANKLAIALDARSLLLVTDVPAVLRDVGDPASRIPRLTIAEGKKAIADGVVTKGMIPKLEESFAALLEGVRAVHIVGRLSRGQLAREAAEPGSVGTVLVT